MQKVSILLIHYSLKVGEGVSLLLYGPETFYNDLEFLAVAEVLFCNPISDYYYQWAIKGISSDSFATEFLNVKGSVLRLPPVVLEEDKDYEFVATIFNNNSEPMATVSIGRHSSTVIFIKLLFADFVASDSSLKASQYSKHTSRL